MAISMFSSSTTVSTQKMNERIQAAIGASVEDRAHSKKSLPVRAPSKRSTRVDGRSTPCSSSAHPAASMRRAGDRSTHVVAWLSPNDSLDDDRSSTVHPAPIPTSGNVSSTAK